jgi:hypothetical protein
MTQEWTDGVALVRRDGRTVTVQVLGDVWITTHADEHAAMLAYLSEVETEQNRGCVMTRFETARRLSALVVVAGDRALRGAEMAAADHVHHLAGDLYLVIGSGGAGIVYVVDVAAGSCNCPDGHAPHDGQGRKYCKHMCAVLMTTGAA